MLSRWWKCDLQVATPNAKDFRGPSTGAWNRETQEQQEAAAARYMEAVKAAGIEVIALADHNDASWVKAIVDAGDDAGVAVFPGVEITTGSGADGIHLVVIGERDATTEDFEDVLSRVCGFGGRDHPRFDPARGTPCSAPRTLLQILDELPDRFLVIAPHAFNENGIASENTVKGDLRWKALHHERLNAVDVGDVRTIENPSSWHARFARRELSDFPRLDGLAFVSTSDAYSLDDFGKRFTWIRMGEPTLEGLRQAFLDHQVRIACDWNDAHPATSTPNDIGHAWIERITLSGLATAHEPLEIPFDPRLNVIIGGRGSGKSTVVAGLRLLYGEVDGLPPQAGAEFKELRGAVFDEAQLQAVHHLAHSGESQIASWTRGVGAQTVRPESGDGSTATDTDFKVRVVNQKELFERAAHNSTDPTSTSRNLLALVDDALATGSASPGGPAAFLEALDDAQRAWVSAAREEQSERDATAQRDIVAARIEELRRQVDAFDSAENKQRRLANDVRESESAWLSDAGNQLTAALDDIEARAKALTDWASPLPPPIEADDDVRAELEQLKTRLRATRESAKASLAAAVAEARHQLREIDALAAQGQWAAEVELARDDAVKYLSELAALGVDADEYERVREALSVEVEILRNIDLRIAKLGDLSSATTTAWTALEDLLAARHARRVALLTGVAERSKLLRFDLVPRADVSQWTRAVRDLLGLRVDGFLEDVPALGAWLWDRTTQEHHERFNLWVTACLTGHFAALTAKATLRPAWVQRIADLDPLVRARLASIVPDDLAEMAFLREGGDPARADDWQALTTGSPGQRSAAMLSFVLHHGVEPLVLDQPEDDLDTEWIARLVVQQLRASRWSRQLIVVTHNANIPVNADAEQIIVLENLRDGLRVRATATEDGGVREFHAGPIEAERVRRAIQQIMEGGVAAFVSRERRYNNELNTYREAMQALSPTE